MKKYAWTRMGVLHVRRLARVCRRRGAARCVAAAAARCSLAGSASSRSSAPQLHGPAESTPGATPAHRGPRAGVRSFTA